MARTITQAPPGREPFARGSIIWEKKGPLPVWAWALLVLLGLVVFTWWRRNKADATQTSSTAADTSNLSAGPVFIVPGATPPAVNVTVPAPVIVSKGNPGPLPPTSNPSPVPPPSTGGGTPTPPAGGTTPPATKPAPAPAPKASGGYVTVTSWPDNSVPRESTLWDIAGSWLPAGAANWGQIWNDPKNAGIRSSRGSPDLIRQGDRIWVPGKLSSPRSSY